jgi:hypothetical protein
VVRAEEEYLIIASSIPTVVVVDGKHADEWSIDLALTPVRAATRVS